MAINSLPSGREGSLILSFNFDGKYFNTDHTHYFMPRYLRIGQIFQNQLIHNLKLIYISISINKTNTMGGRSIYNLVGSTMLTFLTKEE